MELSVAMLTNNIAPSDLQGSHTGPVIAGWTGNDEYSVGMPFISFVKGASSS